MKSNLWRVHPAREMFHYFNQGLVMSAACETWVNALVERGGETARQRVSAGALVEQDHETARS